MKNLDLNAYGVSEMTGQEVLAVNGGGTGGPPMSTYLTQKQIEAAATALRDAADYVASFFKGLWEGKE